MMKLLLNHAVEAMGLRSTHAIGTLLDGAARLLDGAARHTPEGAAFSQAAMDDLAGAIPQATSRSAYAQGLRTVSDPSETDPANPPAASGPGRRQVGVRVLGQPERRLHCRHRPDRRLSPGSSLLAARLASMLPVFGIQGSLGVKPGGREEVIALLLRDVEGLRAAGCHVYSVGVDDEHENTVWVSEVWDSEAHHRDSLKLPAVQAAIAEAMPLPTGDFSQQRLTVVGGLGLPRVES